MGDEKTPLMSRETTNFGEQQHQERHADADHPTVVGKNGSGAGHRKTRNHFDEEFETAIKPIYPKRDGDQRWKEAFSYFRAARKAGEPLEAMVAGVKRYAAWCKRKGFIGPDKAKQAATFFGREKCWLEPWVAEWRSEQEFVG